MGNPVKTVTGMAEYTCKIKMPYVEVQTVTEPVFATVAEGEDPAAKLAEEARALERTIAGCYDVRFQKLLAGPNPVMTTAADQKTAGPQKTEEASLGLRILRFLAQGLADYGKTVRRCQEAGGSYYECKGAP